MTDTATTVAVPSFVVEGGRGRVATLPRWSLEYLGRLFMVVGAIYMGAGVIWLCV